MNTRPKRGELPALPRRAFTRAEALAHGVTSWQFKDPRLARPFRGVRIAPPDPSAGARAANPAQEWREAHLELARAFCCIMRPGQFFAGLTAAVIWKLPIPVNVHRKQCLEVGVDAPRAAPRRNGVQGVQFAPRLIVATERDGLATLDVASIWATLGPKLDLPDRVALGDAIVHAPRIGGNLGPPPRRAFATLRELREASEHRGRKGKGRLREALPLLRAGIASAPESHLRLALAAAGLPEPVIDFDVYGPHGQYLGTTEFAYPELKIVVEYEGDHHRTVVKQWNRDIEKYGDYEEFGWKVIRVTAQLLYRRRADLMDKVASALVSRGWVP